MAYKHSTNAMKKLTFMMLLAAFFTLCVTSCSKDDDDSFAYPMEQLYGKWKAVEIKVDGRWYDSMALATWETAVVHTLLAAKPLQRM